VDVDHQALSSFTEAGLKLNDKSVILLGCVVGCDDATIATVLASHPRLRKDQLVAFKRIPLMRKQTAMLALQRLTATVLTNRLRAMSPASTEQHAARYDKDLLACAHTVIGVTEQDGDKYDPQLQSCTSAGGFGLLSAVTIAPAAFIAGAENTLRWSPVFRGVWQGAVPLADTCCISAAINDSITRINNLEQAVASGCDAAAVGQLSASILPSDAASFVRHFQALPPCEIQSAITQRISTLSFIARVTAAGKSPGGVQEVARMKALKERDSALWLTLLPTEPSLVLSDSQWSWSARLRLGMPAPVASAECHGCHQADAFTNNSWHPLSCVALSATAWTRRHNQVLAVIDRFCRTMLVHTEMEPAGLDADSENRPDIQIDLPEKTVLGDVTVLHPTASSWRKLVAKRDVAAAGDKKAAAKNKKYAEMAKRKDMEFYPIVFYTYGGFHSSTLRFIAALCDAFDPAVALLSRAEFKRALKQQIAIVVQRGTANIMIQETQQMRSKRGGRSSHAHLARDGLSVTVASLAPSRSCSSQPAPSSLPGSGAVAHLPKAAHAAHTSADGRATVQPARESSTLRDISRDAAAEALVVIGRMEEVVQAEHAADVCMQPAVIATVAASMVGGDTTATVIALVDGGDVGRMTLLPVGREVTEEKERVRCAVSAVSAATAATMMDWVGPDETALTVLSAVSVASGGTGAGDMLQIVTDVMD
jgi:hypothetical protein